MMNTADTEFSSVKVYFTHEVSKALEIEDNVNLKVRVERHSKMRNLYGCRYYLKMMFEKMDLCKSVDSLTFTTEGYSRTREVLQDKFGKPTVAETYVLTALFN